MTDGGLARAATRRPRAIEAALREPARSSATTTSARVRPRARAQPRRDRRRASSAARSRTGSSASGRYHPSRLVLCAVEPGRDDDRRVGRDRHRGRRTPGHIAVGRERVELDIGERHLRQARHDRRPAAGPRPRDDGVGAARPRRRRRRAAPAGADRADRLAGRARRRRPRSSARPTWPTTPTSSTSRGCARRRGASASPPPSTRRRCARGLGADLRGHRPPPRGLARRRAAVLRLAVLAAGLAAGAFSEARRQAPRGARARAARGEIRCASTRSSSRRAGARRRHDRDGLGPRVSLDRGPGGLKSVRRDRDGKEQSWTVLGASRGEAGILGEGVRQALLRDPTYKPALSAARELL